MRDVKCPKCGHQKLYRIMGIKNKRRATQNAVNRLWSLASFILNPKSRIDGAVTIINEIMITGRSKYRKQSSQRKIVKRYICQKCNTRFSIN